MLVPASTCLHVIVCCKIVCCQSWLEAVGLKSGWYALFSCMGLAVALRPWLVGTFDQVLLVVFKDE